MRIIYGYTVFQYLRKINLYLTVYQFVSIKLYIKFDFNALNIFGIIILHQTIDHIIFILSNIVCKT